ncbi:recombinase family protein [Halorubellus sp. PRR65]|uniref:recombinase family protein n=1 Tax=Halorubellus sp. PRR65 TaxID=3098148 RepID=UPI002B257074|nr:recombinase family protein [Halorubellus sp. PRR65]
MTESDTVLYDTTLYARVSTPSQNIAQQKEKLWKVATEEHDIDPSSIDVLEDEATGGNTDRAGYQEMMRRVREGETNHVFIRSITRLGRNMRDLNEAVHEIVEDHGVGLTVINDGINISPGTEELDLEQKAILYGLSFASDIEHEMIKQRTLDGLRAAEEAGKRIGRPIYGFTSEDGNLRPDDEEYEKAVQAIIAKEELGWSDRRIQRQIGVPRRTVPSVVERRDIYLGEKLDEDMADQAVDGLAERTRDDLEALEEQEFGK